MQGAAAFLLPSQRRTVLRPQLIEPTFGQFEIRGYTRNSAGAVLGLCVVDLFESATDLKLDTTVSDELGYFSFRSPINSRFCYMVAYKPGSPDVAGTTVDTLVPGAYAVDPRIPADMWLDFATGNNGDPVNAAYMAANARGVAPYVAWSVTAGTPTVSTVQAKAALSPIRLDGSATYTDTTTRSVEFSHANANSIITQLFPASSGPPWPYEATMGFWWKSTVAEPDTTNGTFDFISLQTGGGSEFGVFQFHAWQVWAHSNGVPNTGNPIDVHRDTWYWIYIRLRRRYGCSLFVYDATGKFLGNSTAYWNGVNVEGCRHIEIGNLNPHGQFPSGSIFFGGLFINFKTPHLQMGP